MHFLTGDYYPECDYAPGWRTIMLIFEIIGAIGAMMFLAALIAGARPDGYVPTP